MKPLCWPTHISAELCIKIFGNLLNSQRLFIAVSYQSFGEGGLGLAWRILGVGEREPHICFQDWALISQKSEPPFACV